MWCLLLLHRQRRVWWVTGSQRRERLQTPPRLHVQQSELLSGGDLEKCVNVFLRWRGVESSHTCLRFPRDSALILNNLTKSRCSDDTWTTFQRKTPTASGTSLCLRETFKGMNSSRHINTLSLPDHDTHFILWIKHTLQLDNKKNFVLMCGWKLFAPSA